MGFSVENKFCESFEGFQANGSGYGRFSTF